MPDPTRSPPHSTIAKVRRSARAGSCWSTCGEGEGGPSRVGQTSSLSVSGAVHNIESGELAGATGLPAPPARHGAAQWLAGPWTEPSIDPSSSCCCRPRPACLPHPPTVRTRASSWQETSWQQSHPHRTRAIQVGVN